MHKCYWCGRLNAIVNQCRCDPNNLPTQPFTVTHRCYSLDFGGWTFGHPGNEPIHLRSIYPWWAEHVCWFHTPTVSFITNTWRCEPLHPAAAAIAAWSHDTPQD